MFRTLIYPSSGACDCVVELPHLSSCSEFIMCWRFGAAGFEWCSYCRLKHNLCFSLQYVAFWIANNLLCTDGLFYYFVHIEIQESLSSLCLPLFHALCKGKSFPLQAWRCPEVSRKLRFPDYMTPAQDGGKFVSITHRPPLPPSKYS